MHARPRCNRTRTCVTCLASAAHSRLHTVAREHRLVIQSWADECARKISGGDVWVVRALNANSLYRVVATDLANGSYVAPLHGSDELMNVSAELWFSSADDDEALPWSLSTHAYDVSAMYPSRTNLCRRAAHSACRSEGALAKLPLMRSKKQKCKALASAFTCVALPTKQHTVRLHGAAHRAAPLEPCASLATGPSAPALGRWVSAMACSAGLCDADEAALAAKDHSRRAWVPFGCKVPAPSSGRRPCTAPGSLVRCARRRRLVIIGDSVSRGNFLDLCVMIGAMPSDNRTCHLLDPRSMEGEVPPATLPPTAAIVFAPLFGDHTYRAGVGLGNLFRTPLIEAAWERLLINISSEEQRETVVIFGSGVHDIHATIINKTTGESELRVRKGWN